MPLSRLFAVGLWLCVTVAATAIVWAGTSTVAADLTDRPAPVVAHNEVVDALQSDVPAPETAPGISAPGTTVANPTVAPNSPGEATAGPTAQPGPSGSDPPPPADAVPTPVPATPPVTEPTSPPTTQPPNRSTASFSTAGGVATVACNNGYFIELVSATPSNGYAAKVVSGGPYFVEVHFVRPGRDDPLWAYCLGRPVQAYGGAPQVGQGPG